MWHGGVFFLPVRCTDVNAGERIWLVEKIESVHLKCLKMNELRSVNGCAQVRQLFFRFRK